MKNTVIYLLGFPGTGKYTIGREIMAQSRARLIDNHLINNPIFSVIRVDGKTKLPKEIWDYTGAIGDIVREAIVKLAPAEESFIFTNALMVENAPDQELYEKIVALAEQRNSLFVPVRLLCALSALQTRIVGPDRHERMKMTDAEGIARYHSSYTVFIPDHPHTIELDVTHLQPHEAAQAILAHVERLMALESGER